MCTELPAHGLNIAGIRKVINYDMPHDAREFKHRVSRTAHPGKENRCRSVVCAGCIEKGKMSNAVVKMSTDQLAVRSVPTVVVAKLHVWVNSMLTAVNQMLR